MSLLFSPLKIKNQNFKNRIFVSPMCQYSAVDGFSQPWHFVHYGGFAKGGAGLVMLEATAVSPEGRISPQDLGIWNHQQAESLRPLIDFIHAQGSVSCIQLAHAGRKASTAVPWKGRGWISEREGGWQPLGPSKISFNEMSGIPKEMATEDLEKVKRNFIDAALRCHEVGVQSIEIHAAHGYLMHQFLSPVSNHRNDKYGGSLENRMRFPLEVVQAVRKVWPEDKPLFVRLSATDWLESQKDLDSWNLEQTFEFVKAMKLEGVDLIDVSTGGLSPLQQIPVEPLYQVSFAAEILKKCRIKTGAVGLITEAFQAETILQKGQADVVFIGRELLRNPQWPLKAAQILKEAGSFDLKSIWPIQYQRAIE